MADEKKTEETKKTEAPKVVDKSGVATYNQDEPNTIKVRAADGTQMYDPVTRTLYTDAKKGTEARENDQFVQSNLTRGKLKKV